MDLIERYLESLRWLLPSEGRDDILAELRDVLTTRREEKQAELGRPLTRAEDEALLHAFGNPIAVAGRYGRQRYLIGPETYPVYSLVLKIVLIMIAGSALITAIAVTVADQGDAARGLVRGLDVLWNGAFGSIGIITLIFAGLERSGAFRQMSERWRARDLPRTPVLRRPRQQTWIDWVSAIVVHLLFILWWVGAIHFWPADIAAKPGGGVLRFAFAPELSVLYWPVLAVSASVIGVNLLKLASRETRPIGAWLDLVVRAATGAIAAFALHAGHWLIVTGVGVPAADLAKAQQGLDVGAQVTLAVLICVSLIGIAAGAWRLLKPAKAAQGRAANGA
jgi:hypothetical protein